MHTSFTLKAEQDSTMSENVKLLLDVEGNEGKVKLLNSPFSDKVVGWLGLFKEQHSA